MCLPGIELQQALAGDGAVELPAKPAEHIIALAKTRIARARDLADDAAFDDGTDLDRPGIGTLAADPPAHIGVERQIDAAHQHLALGGVGQRRIGYLEIGQGRRPGRPPLQQYLAVAVLHRLFLLPAHHAIKVGIVAPISKLAGNRWRCATEPTIALSVARSVTGYFILPAH